MLDTCGQAVHTALNQGKPDSPTVWSRTVNTWLPLDNRAYSGHTVLTAEHAVQDAEQFPWGEVKGGDTASARVVRDAQRGIPAVQRASATI